MVCCRSHASHVGPKEDHAAQLLVLSLYPPLGCLCAKAALPAWIAIEACVDQGGVHSSAEAFGESSASHALINHACF